jgi:hypothetical protein
MKLYHTTKDLTHLPHGIGKRLNEDGLPQCWHITIPYWVDLFKKPYMSERSFGIDKRGRHEYSIHFIYWSKYRRSRSHSHSTSGYYSRSVPMFEVQLKKHPIGKQEDVECLEN